MVYLQGKSYVIHTGALPGFSRRDAIEIFVALPLPLSISDGDVQSDIAL